MKARQQRWLAVAAVLVLLGLATYFVVNAFRQNLVFFYTPTQVQAGEAPTGRAFRIGGLVEAGSLHRQADGVTVAFIVTDTARRLPVRYRGILPDLFREGRGVVAQGQWQNGIFVAAEVLAKHDENYMPPEAKHAVDEAHRKSREAQP
ncbi:MULTISPECIES: cytochrome c maturation protein CcmE [Chitinibacter]|uniref:cytochrome c maturation protein CcmE n=1 Tax=Chitinibacter TaxID=230666 RepID=UPI00064576CC|nr:MULTISPECIES: cytochrome c maturation protein CcmE [Chitinibacter]